MANRYYVTGYVVAGSISEAVKFLDKLEVVQIAQEYTAGPTDEPIVRKEHLAVGQAADWNATMDALEEAADKESQKG